MKENFPVILGSMGQEVSKYLLFKWTLLNYSNEKLIREAEPMGKSLKKRAGPHEAGPQKRRALAIMEAHGAGWYDGDFQDTHGAAVEAWNGLEQLWFSVGGGSHYSTPGMGPESGAPPAASVLTVQYAAAHQRGECFEGMHTATGTGVIVSSCLSYLQDWWLWWQLEEFHTLKNKSTGMSHAWFTHPDYTDTIIRRRQLRDSIHRVTGVQLSDCEFPDDILDENDMRWTWAFVRERSAQLRRLNKLRPFVG